MYKTPIKKQNKTEQRRHKDLLIKHIATWAAYAV